MIDQVSQNLDTLQTTDNHVQKAPITDVWIPSIIQLETQHVSSCIPRVRFAACESLPRRRLRC